MAVHYKLEAYVPINAPADKFYDVHITFPTFRPNGFRTANCIGETAGIFMVVALSRPGLDIFHRWKTETFKERVEFDDATKTMTLIGLEGYVFKEFKHYKIICQKIPKDSSSCVVKNVIEYEKLRDDGPDAHKYLDFIVASTKNMAAHLVKA